MKISNKISLLIVGLLINQSWAYSQPPDESDLNKQITAGIGVASCSLVMAAACFDTAKHHCYQNNYEKYGKICGYASSVCLATGSILFLGILLPRKDR
ncbi:MAG TPA: hypothetical protein VHO47_04750 [Candidatus Babeliales bacterium]|nr:hypothetical protein [Candidatus Babeliales bacterium]